MDLKKIEKKWQERWDKDKLAKFNPKNIGKKYYFCTYGKYAKFPNESFI